jgi:hypothetical protein
MFDVTGFYQQSVPPGFRDLEAVEDVKGKTGNCTVSPASKCGCDVRKSLASAEGSVADADGTVMRTGLIFQTFGIASRHSIQNLTPATSCDEIITDEERRNVLATPPLVSSQQQSDKVQTSGQRFVSWRSHI